MKLSFPIPNLVQVKALMQPWQLKVTGAEQTRLAKWADKLGYAMIGVPEHHIIPRDHVDLSGPHYFNAYVGMAHFAGATKRIRVTSCISLFTMQSPIITAKQLSTMDWLSSGRVSATFAVGWLEKEFELLRVPFHERGAMADEYIQAIIELWTKEDPEFDGKYVSFKNVAFEPKCVQTPHVPIWFGGDADAVLKRVARYGRGWWPFLTKPEDFPARIDFIKSQPDYNGQLEEVISSLSIGRVGEGHVVIDDPDTRPSHNKQWIIDRLGAQADLGVTTSSVTIPELDDVEAYFDYTQWVAEEIMPAVADV